MEHDRYDPEQMRKEAFEHSDQIGANETRLLLQETTRAPTQRESREAIEAVTSQTLNPMLKAYTNADLLKKLKTLSQEEMGHLLSTPLLSASVLSAIAQLLEKETTESFKNSPLLSLIPADSICGFDTSAGIQNIALPIYDTECVIRGTFDRKLDLMTEQYAGGHNMAQMANIFLAQKAKASEYASLLTDDPTGNSLIRHAVEEIEQSSDQDEWFAIYTKEFLVHGARFAQRAYGIIYPLAEKVNKLP